MDMDKCLKIIKQSYVIERTREGNIRVGEGLSEMTFEDSTRS